ncbi:MAG: FGGY family carbohydrate kinase, partial [Candidatus Coproplasma sp.]
MSKLILGIEFGSTRIKSVLIDEQAKVLSSGGYDWENSLVDGLWSYSLGEAVKGMQVSYAELVKNYGKDITSLDAIGISGMMHGYIALDKDDKLLAPFRTWRNTNTGEAAAKLSELFNFNVPMRWSVSQYYQSFSDGLDHVKDVVFLTTLAGYIHYLLTGEKVLGADDASGMFPLSGNDYDSQMLAKFNALIGKDFKELLPKVLLAGEKAGTLTKEGALLLDPTGKLQSGAIACPPEGDMGTGMICTNAVAPRTGNVSSGTSVNLTVILEKPLQNYYSNIDIVATPDGYPAALVHSNNGTTEINEWVGLFAEVSALCGSKINKGELFTKLFKKSQESDGEVGKISAYNYAAGEVQAGTINGAPLVVREPSGEFNLANFMQSQIYSAVAPLALGMDILEKEDVKIDSVTAHG